MSYPLGSVRDMTGMLEQLRGLALDVFVPALSDGDVDAGGAVVWAAEQRLAALRLSLVRESSGRDIPKRQGALKTSLWLAAKLRISQAAAAEMVRLAEALDTTIPATGAALAAGEVSVDQAMVLADTIRKLSPPVRARAEGHLLGLAEEFAAPQLRKLAAHLQDVVDPDGAEQRRRDMFARKERRDAECGITLSRLDGDDLWQLRGKVNGETAAIIQAALDPLCNPRRHRNPIPAPPNNTDTPPTDPSPPDKTTSTPTTTPPTHRPTPMPPNDATASASPANAPASVPQVNAPTSAPQANATKAAPLASPTTAASPSNATASGPPAHATTSASLASPTTSASPTGGPDGEATPTVSHGMVIEDVQEPMADLRTAAARRLDALKDICLLALAGGQLPDNGGDRPQLVITVSWQDLRDQVGAGTLDDGTALSPADTRRLACDSQILPAILNSRSVPLDLGRERRLYTGPLRRALDIRDKGCTFPGCDRPRQWTTAHHIRHWADGGPTTLDNGVLLCDRHHHLIHQGEWQVRINLHDRLPEFVPPTYVDPTRRPRRNAYHLRS